MGIFAEFNTVIAKPFHLFLHQNLYSYKKLVINLYKYVKNCTAIRHYKLLKLQCITYESNVNVDWLVNISSRTLIFADTKLFHHNKEKLQKKYIVTMFVENPLSLLACSVLKRCNGGLNSQLIVKYLNK